MMYYHCAEGHLIGQHTCEKKVNVQYNIQWSRFESSIFYTGSIEGAEYQGGWIFCDPLGSGVDGLHGFPCCCLLLLLQQHKNLLLLLAGARCYCWLGVAALLEFSLHLFCFSALLLFGYLWPLAAAEGSR